MSNFYRKKPVVVEVMRLTDETMWKVRDWIGDRVKEWCWDEVEKYIYIKTLEGNMLAREGDWIIKGVKGEFYPCQPDIFEMTYEHLQRGDELE